MREVVVFDAWKFGLGPGVDGLATAVIGKTMTVGFETSALSVERFGRRAARAASGS